MPTTLNSVALDELGLDPENPRLPTTVKRDSGSMLEYIARTSSITELMTAIGQHGYFPGEPLIVIPSGKRKPKYIVAEGNRRLTALKLLADPGLMPKSSSIRTTAEEAEQRTTHVPCILFSTRDEVMNYLGYRHITGIKQWEPLAKARYISQYFDTQTAAKSSAESRYKVVAKSIGSRPSYIKRQLDGIAVFNIIENSNFFEIADLDEENVPFSILTTALGYDSVLKYVCSTENPYTNPSKIKREQVKELASWLFQKDAEGETRLGDSRNIKKLALILESPDAIKELRGGASVDAAYNKTRGVSLEFTELLISVERDISKALSMIALIKFDDRQTQRISNIRKQAIALSRLSETAEE